MAVLATLPAFDDFLDDTPAYAYGGWKIAILARWWRRDVPTPALPICPPQFASQKVLS